ncbi:hypothetical protein [Mariniblastus fucicola]|uniref:Uncharacterized protein n=1 Tax=Mariniblastus fucicola TaxID=980251 RepID=A0A5B9PD13_9BACT|nr:hypothetical protein [Mariniblastus fucicola]QEG20931.1 hypothetical protein MFFC18_07820 [Mariniblastus fucicola]
MLSDFPPNRKTSDLNRNTLALRLICILVAVVSIGSLLHFNVQSETQVAQLQGLIPDELTADPLSADDHELVEGLAGTVSAMEWLGPLAPIAISPFFGLACLCGISQYGGDWLPLNAFVSDNPVLQNPAVLWTFVILTVVTSLPRLTKVSKPIGQAIDQLEAWSGIIAIIVIRVASATSDPVGDTTAMAMVPVFECGFVSMSADVLFSIAAIINILVINTIKFFFEVSVWLMPFPFVDAMLEAANKSACAALMAVYAWSPFWATMLNLVIFLACLWAFRWVKRQVTYMRSILFDPVWAMVQKSWAEPKKNSLTVFPQYEIGPFAARERLSLSDVGDSWLLIQSRMLLPSRSFAIPKDQHQLLIHPGMIVNKICIEGSEPGTLLFTRRFNDHLPKLAGLLNMTLAEKEEQLPSVSDLVLDSQ